MNIQENLKAYLDGELSPSEAAQVEAALSQDASLRTELQQLQSIRSVLASSAPTAAPVGLDATLDRLQRTAPHASPWLLPAGLGITAVAAVCLVGWLMNSTPPPPFHEESPMPTPKHRAPFKGATGFKILLDAKVSVSVANLEEASAKAKRMVESRGGTLDSVRTLGEGPSAQQTLFFTIPALKTKEAIEQFKTLGVVEKQIEARDPLPSKGVDENQPDKRVVSLVLRLAPSR